MIIRDEFYNKIQLHELYPGTKIRWIESNNRETILTKNGMGNRFTIKTKIANLIYCTDRQYNYNIP